MNFKPVSAKNAEYYTWGGKCDACFLLKGDDIHVIQERMPPGSAEIAQVHLKSRHHFYALRGELTMANASAAATIPAGHAVFIEPNVPHRATNESAEDVEFLVIPCPPSHGDRLDCETRIRLTRERVSRRRAPNGNTLQG